MDAPQPVYSSPAKQNQILLIVAAVVVVLCCCVIWICAIGFYSFFTIRNVDTQEMPPFESTVPAIPDDFETPTEEPDSVLPPGDSPGDPPEGGLGNEILKNDTWQDVAAAAVGQGCDRPSGAESTIEVLQEPDAGGVWLEEWTVVCDSGDSYDYEVEYIPDDTGTTFNIRSIP